MTTQAASSGPKTSRSRSVAKHESRARSGARARETARRSGSRPRGRPRPTRPRRARARPRGAPRRRRARRAARSRRGGAGRSRTRPGSSSSGSSSVAEPRSEAIERSPAEAIETTTPFRARRRAGELDAVCRELARRRARRRRRRRASRRSAPRRRATRPRRRRSRPARRRRRGSSRPVVARDERPVEPDDHVEDQVAEGDEAHAYDGLMDESKGRWSFGGGRRCARSRSARRRRGRHDRDAFAGSGARPRQSRARGPRRVRGRAVLPRADHGLDGSRRRLSASSNSAAGTLPRPCRSTSTSARTGTCSRCSTA